MKSIDDLRGLLGQYFGEPDVARFLADLGITSIPKLTCGDATAIVFAASSGVEVTFRDADTLDVATREYPKEALVLTNVRFYGVQTEDFFPYAGVLPGGVAFGATRQTLIDGFGTPARNNLVLRQMRWDFSGYCVFAKFGEQDDMIIFSMQLPVA